MRAAAGATVAIAVALSACGDDPVRRTDTDVSDVAVDLPADMGRDARPDADDVEDTGIRDADDEPDGSEPDLGPYRFVTTAPPLAQAGEAWQYEPTTEPDASDLRIAIGPDGSFFEAGVLEWTPPPRDANPGEFSIDAWVGDRSVASQTFTVDVNHPPELLDSPATTGAVGDLWSYVPTVVDPDDDPVETALDVAPDWLSADADGIAGVPTEPGTFEVTLTFDDGRGGSAVTTFTISIAERVRDLSASTYHLGNVDAAFRLFGCCFDDTPEVYWGGSPLLVERVNAGRLDLSFETPPLPGTQMVQLLRGELPIGELPRPVTVIPEPIWTDEGVEVVGPLGGRSVRVIDHAGVTQTELVIPPDTERWVLESAGVVFVEIDGVGSAPVLAEAVAEAVVFSIEPRVHSAGDRLEIVFSGDPGADPVARWGDATATCFRSEGDRCSVLVPSDAAGFVMLEGPAGPLESVTSAIAGSVAAAEGGRWIDWASRRSVPAGETSYVVVSSLGGVPTSPDAELELVELTDTRSVVAITPGDSDTVTIRVRDDELTLGVD